VNVLSTTMTYPTASWPARGVFVRRRLEAMGRRLNVRVVAPCAWFPGRRMPRGSPGDDRLVTMRPTMFYVPGVLKHCDPLFYARVLERSIQGMADAFRPDLIDAHYVWPDGVAAARVAQRMGLPLAITVRGKIVSHGRYPARVRQMRDALRRADVRIAVSADLAERAAAIAADGRPVEVIPNGVDAAEFHPMDRRAMRLSLGLDPRVRYLVSVGYVQELKGFDRVVAQLPGVREALGDVRLLLVGEDVGERDYVARLDRMIAGTGRGPFVKRINGAGPATIARILNAADAFVLATRSEGWCNAIHEALACGTPVVATDVGGNRELVRTAGDGLLSPFGDGPALRDAMIAVLSATWDRPAIAARAARSWDDVAHEVCRAFGVASTDNTVIPASASETAAKAAFGRRAARGYAAALRSGSSGAF
jgi:glycosyltransferase involved in cell wall biosynthesis